jgi:hypothetical protein
MHAPTFRLYVRHQPLSTTVTRRRAVVVCPLDLDTHNVGHKNGLPVRSPAPRRAIRAAIERTNGVKAVRMHEFGGRDKLVVDDVPDPEPPPGEVRIKIDVCALNHVDVDIREGISRFEISLPHILGLEVVGRVDSLGTGAEGFEVGDRVMPYLWTRFEARKSTLTFNRQ